MHTTKKKILLIDDEEVILFGFSQVLSGPEITVDTASTVDDAKALIANNSYNAAIVDLRLSNSTALEGLELVAMIKNSRKECRVIIFTAYGDDTTRQKAIAAGADLFLEKPMDPVTIRQYLLSLGVC